MGAPAEQDIVITRGDTLTVVVIMTSDGTTPINITGRTYSAQVRQYPNDSTANGTMTCTVTDGAAGEVTCVLSATATAAINDGRYYWDLQENASGIISTPLGGAFVVLPDVTR